MKFEELTKEVQDYILERFSSGGIDGKTAFENNNIFPEDFMQLEPEEMIKILELKEISHKYSRSNYPELESDINNVILEDIAENRSRGNKTMTIKEEETSMRDFIDDINDGDIDDDGIVDIESILEEADNNDAIFDIIGLALPIGIIFSGINVIRKIKTNEIVLNDVPTEFVYDTGKKTIKLAVVGSLLSTGSPIIVSSTVALTLYNSRELLERIFKRLYRGVTNPQIISRLKSIILKNKILFHCLRLKS
jgi:hypothetical protein